jgi:tRNA(adenine34) deaminase
MPQQFMRRALALAEQAAREGEVPVGAVVVYQGEVVGEGYNQPIRHNDPTLHAEVVAIRQAAQRLGNYRLLDCDLYVTLEPCPMCAGAMLYARVKRLFFAAYDEKAGAVQSVFQCLDEPRLNHRIEWQGGILADEARTQLKSFFKARR